jgi:hypothetical protein
MRNVVKIVLLLVLVVSLYSETITKKYKLGSSTVERVEGHVSFNMVGGFKLGKVGDPGIPYFTSSLLLNDGEVAKSVEVVDVEYGEILEDIDLLPVVQGAPISKLKDTPLVIKKNEGIYNSNQLFPQNLSRDLHTGYLRGSSIASFAYPSAQYNPVTKQLHTINSITFNLITESDSGKIDKVTKKTSSLTSDRLMKLVDNPEKIRFEYTKNSDKIDILLLTSESLEPHFTEYVNYKKRTGFKTEVVTVEYIYSNYSGSDDQEKIRNCVKDYYENNEIEYLILGGDSDPQNSSGDIIPHRGFYCDPDYPSMADNDIPADIYYSNLDGDWDSDGDNNYAEPGEEDFYAELSVGRICVGTQEEIENSTHKLQSYQQSPVAESIENYLMVGELLWEGIWGKMYLTMVSEGSSEHGYTTVGFNENINRETLYQQDGNWSTIDLYNMFNTTGINMLHHLGHSSTTYNMLLNNSDLTTSNFTNDGISKGYVLGYSQGCYPGAFDNRETSAGAYVEDCFCEKITNMETAEAAFIGNSRYGWGDNTGTDGPSNYYHREYVDAIFGENITRIGDANRDSKEDNVGFVAGNGMVRWCYYQLNLFGDPTLDIFTETPTEFSCTTPEAIMIGVSNLTISSEVPFSRSALIQNEEVIAFGAGDENGDIEYNFSSPISNASPITMVITGHNKYEYEKVIPVLSDQPYLVVESLSVDDSSGNNNGQADFGETINLDLVIKNVGNQPSEAATITLSNIEGGNYTINDDNSTVIALDGGESTSISGAFNLDIPLTIEDQEKLRFKISFEEGSASYESFIKFTGNAPKLEYDIDLSLGMVSGGDDLTISYNVTNSGHADLTGVESQLEIAPSQYVDITNSSEDLGDIIAGATKSCSYDLTFSESTPIATLFQFDLQLSNSDNYTDMFEHQLLVNNPTITETDFSEFPPEGWSIEGGSNWGSSVTSNAGGSGPEANFDWNPELIADQYLITPTINSVGLYGVKIRFRYSVNDYNGDYQLSIVGSGDNGSNWEELLSIPSENIGATLDSLELTEDNCSFIGSDEVKFGFLYSGNSYNINNWYVDDVRLSVIPTSDIGEQLPSITSLYQNYPNPFNPTTTIRFDIAKDSSVKLQIYNGMGQMVNQLISKDMNAGTHHINFDATSLSSGVYYYKLIAGDKVMSRKMLLIK